MILSWVASWPGREPGRGQRRPHSYPFWAVEYMYTDGTPAADSQLAAFIAYMSTDAAKSVLQSYGNIPCSFTTLCP